MANPIDFLTFQFTGARSFVVRFAYNGVTYQFDATANEDQPDVPMFVAGNIKGLDEGELLTLIPLLTGGGHVFGFRSYYGDMVQLSIFDLGDNKDFDLHGSVLAIGEVQIEGTGVWTHVSAEI